MVEEGSLPTFVRDAHSLYFETVAELGIVGLLLIGGLIVVVLGTGATRALRRGPPERRGYIAAATAGCFAFATAASVDWVWEVAVVPAAFFLLSAAVLAADTADEPALAPTPVTELPAWTRFALAAGALGPSV